MSLYEKREEEDVQTHKAASPEPSCVSVKSDKSMGVPPLLSDGADMACKISLCEMKEEDFHTHKAASPEPSCVSVKSDKSMGIPPLLIDGAVTSDPEVRRDNVSRPVTPRLSRFICYQNLFRKNNKKTALQTNTQETQMQHISLQPVRDGLQRVKDQHKTSMKKRYERLFEGSKLEEIQTLLNTIYTQLYIIEGENTPIYCNDIFKPLHEPGCEEKDEIKTVLTKGIAGIGKTVSVQKFVLDWTEGKANQDVDFMFVLPFRELNLIKDHQYSLHRLLLDFHPELQDLDSKMYDERDPEKLLKSNRDMIVKLAELAFKQLMKGNVMFYEEDLIESGIDVTDASVYSGICTEIFKQESVIHQRKVHCFIHLSFQEFLAAFFVFYSHVDKNEESLKPLLNKRYRWYSRTNSLYELLEAAVDNSLQSKNGHLDLFLWFLLGFSLESNHRLTGSTDTHSEPLRDHQENHTVH
ncbi:uncharacterized protein LOC107716127 [Sinocyclocheilus rhinocerous]|uniref:uncharacterized protein LOC107716127 n=1 Tax=Sinocyclocheilus rhinocerous TaxID=307959 RepID=UPI0007B7A7CE|nr:PREDICTED: uncharacterized protein LOC107716127 [Sinocyclocheilus rhinocerous]